MFQIIGPFLWSKIILGITRYNSVQFGITQYNSAPFKYVLKPNKTE